MAQRTEGSLSLPANLYIYPQTTIGMELNQKDINKMIIIFIGLILAVLVFLIIKPVILSILGGLILAYIFVPIHKWILKRIKEKNTAALITSFIALIIIFIPLWFIIPLMVQQVFNVFLAFQNFDIQSFILRFFPTASEAFITQTTVTFNSFASKATSGILNVLVNVFLNFPAFLFHIFIIGFVFFFTLRDREQLKQFILELSPLNSTQERILVKKFRNITDSIIYGQIVVGLVQGIIAGIGFLIFRIPNALVLTVLAIILSIIPIIGPGLIWIPVTIYLVATGHFVLAILFFIYNAIIVSSADNFLRPYIVSRYSELSMVTVLIGMIGGLFMFGILGLILGPLILEYFLTFIKAYKEKTLSTIFK
tara:strand:+ start:2235 stop:3332 length:1098 start_codon:yes stop_codon:yes gene_type:complete